MRELARHHCGREIEAIQAVFQRFAPELQPNRVEWGFVTCAISTTALIVEPLIFWCDEANPYHHGMMEPDYLAGLPRHAPNEVGTAQVKRISAALNAEFLRPGCTHLQIRRSYPYRAGRTPETFALLETIKTAMDPQRRVNPGSLGLD